MANCLDFAAGRGRGCVHMVLACRAQEAVLLELSCEADSEHLDCLLICFEDHLASLPRYVGRVWVLCQAVRMPGTHLEAHHR